MNRNSFVCLCTQTISPICIIFNMGHYLTKLNNTNRFQNIQKVFTRNSARTDRQTDGQIYCIYAIQLCWKV